MMRIIDSQLQREADHRKLKSNANLLCNVFSSIFPSTLNPNKGSLRFKVFSKILSLGFIDFNDREATQNIEEFKLFNARSTKKKVIDSFANAGLIEKVGEGVYKKTLMGDVAWQSILNFLENHKPVEQEVIDSGGKVYEYSMWEVTVDEKGNCWYLRNFGFKNTGKKTISSVEHGAFSSETNYKGIFNLQHSDNIEGYELTSDEPLSKMFKLKFKTPLKTGDYGEYWIRYNWQNMYNNSDPKWHFTYHSRKSFVKEFMLRFNFPKDYEIDPDNMIKNNNGEPLPKDCIPFDPIIIENGKYQTMIWRIKNLAPKRQFSLTWKKK